MEAFSQAAQSIDWSRMGATIQQKGLQVIVVLLCLVVHEVCHGLAAYRLGDPTAKASHRLSLNPIHHLDIFGLIMMVSVGFGWAKPVPVDPRYFKNPKQGMAITALAGPASNFVMAYLSAMVFNGIYAVMEVQGESGAIVVAGQFFYSMILMNIGLGIFNLIPFPPLDGSKVVAMFLPDRAYLQWMRLERYGMIILMAALLFGWLNGFLLASRAWVADRMFDGSSFVYQAVINHLG